MNRPNGIFKKGNGYQKAISRELFEKTPKTVFAALTVSYLVNHQGLTFEEIDAEILREWGLLYGQEIVPQKPPTINAKNLQP